MLSQSLNLLYVFIANNIPIQYYPVFNPNLFAMSFLQLDKKNSFLFQTRPLAKSEKKTEVNKNNNKTTQQQGNLDKMSANASTIVPSDNTLGYNHKNTVPKSFPNKTQHKKLPQPDPDRYWNKNGILGSRERGEKVGYDINKDHLLTSANGSQIKGKLWSNRIKTQKSHAKTDVHGKRYQP